MFDTILIANRGEIACRVIRTARAMGLRTVAVHSDVDAGAMHVEMADVAVSLGGATPGESYLRGDAIIAAARATGAQAIHPGYGFLSENPDFVEAVGAAGLVFVGPSAKAIRAMGLKDAAKALMEKAGVPVVPGYHGSDQSDALLAEEAARIGYPVLIKAVAGGGGKGMRLVEAPGEFAGALASARSEAASAFGNPDVLIEKYITSPRHIEVQVFGDGTRAVHLFERDCSLQRRHQKVIEEAPAPGMTPEMRAAMGQAAVRAAEAIGYSGAGTVEFIVDGSEGLRPDGFWFMEMNTRLQVEHPVTELITGVDLVDWQLRVAAGEALPMRQEDLSISGHAFEARLYAEDVPGGFLPATGRLSHLEFPSGVRADTGVRAGDVISPFYDPMIAKVIVHGPTRAVALRQLARGLEETRVAGTVTNIGFLQALARHEGFGRGEVDTGLIARDIAALTVSAAPGSRDMAAAALLALGLESSGGWERGFALWQPLRRQVVLRQGETEYPVQVSLTSARTAQVDVAGDLLDLTFGAGWSDGQGRLPDAVMEAGRITVFAEVAHVLDLVDPLDRVTQGAASDGVTLAPMPGRVVAVFVVAGESVAAGDRLITLEAMKMEHVMTASEDGTVAEVLAKAGDLVEAGAALVRMEDEA